MLTPEERRLVDNIHDFMAYTDNFIKDKNGTEIKSVNYKEIPHGAAILLFGGYKTIGFHAADAVKAYYAAHKQWPDIIITGKSSNKFDNTAGLGSEVNAYQYILENCGIPRSVVRKYHLEPTDLTTAENIQSVEAVLMAHPHLRDQPIVLFTQSYYMRRALHDFAHKLPDQRLIAATLPKADLDNGLFYNDRADGNAIDVMVGACFYQTIYNQARWEKGETIPPTVEELSVAPSKEDIIPLAKKYCGWLYPNNMTDLGIAASLPEGKKLIDERKSRLFAQKEFSPEQQKADIVNAVASYRKQHRLTVGNIRNDR